MEEKYELSSLDIFLDSKREEPRLNTNFPGKFCLTKTREKMDCRIINISSVGLGIQVKSYLKEGEEVEIEFVLDDKLLRFVCTVVYAQGKPVGLKFQDIAKETADFISEYVLSRFFQSGKKKD